MERRTYSTDLTDDQWQKLQECLPKARNGRTGRRRKHPLRENGRTGRRRKHPLREVVNALFYQLRTGCPWRDLPHDLPHDLPPWASVYDQFRRWRDDGTIECLHDTLRDEARKKQGRKKQGRQASPSAAVLDSQTVKAGEKGGRQTRSASTATRRSRAAGGT